LTVRGIQNAFKDHAEHNSAPEVDIKSEKSKKERHFPGQKPVKEFELDPERTRPPVQHERNNGSLKGIRFTSEGK